MIYLKDIISSYKNIILYSYNKFVVSTYNEDLIKSIGLTNLINLPVCKFNKSKCIDNKCSFNNNKCYYKCHSLTNYI